MSIESLTAAEIGRVTGVLGRIGKERLADYAGQPAGQPRDYGRLGQFEAALSRPGLNFIAEVKQASPSQGSIRELDPVATALEYQQAGAAAVSILTEPRHFGGDITHLEAASRQLDIPALRKDFLVHPAQIAEAAQNGASAVLLMVSLLGRHLGAWLDQVQAFGIDALVEVHEESELDIALAAGAGIIGVNNRDLSSLQVDLATAPRLMRLARERGFSGVLVAESGYSNPQELAAIRADANAVLVGTSLAGSGDPGQALARLKRS